MSWREIALGSAIHVKHGFAFKGEFFADQGEHIVLTPGNFHEQGGFRSRPGKDRAYAGDIPEAFILDEGNLIVAMTEQGEGLLGSAALIPEANRYLHNQRLGLVDFVDPMQLDKRFLYLLFNTRSVRSQISGSASGTKVRHTAPERIYRVQVRVPDVRVQAEIADAVLAYDDLIDNNRRRMALLEESARLLYNEWFLRLRFPGHEHTPIVDGVPQGWDRVPLEDALVLQRGFDLPTQERQEGLVPIYGSTGVVGHHHQAKVAAPGVVTGRSGTLGSVHFVAEDYWPLNTALWVKEFKRVTPLFALFLLRSMDLKQYNGGASVPTLDRKSAHRVEILIPSKQLIRSFDDFAADTFKQIKNLESQNQKLRAARDLLLPRLMSGDLIA
ncbi:MAG: restriction endonuclease subunit S [Rubrivivax sp.]|nr:MAG: restriction endonuclease subunit S [Rubrivivax sp.]